MKTAFSFLFLLLCSASFAQTSEEIQMWSKKADQLKNASKWDSAAIAYAQLTALYAQQNQTLLRYQSATSQGECILRKGDYPKAEAWFEQLSLDAQVNKKSLEYAQLLHFWGVTLFYQSQYDKALTCYTQALKIRENLRDKKHIDLARSYNNIALVWNAKQKSKRALAYYEKALPILIQNLGEKHPQTVSLYANLSLAYYSQKDYAKSIATAQKVVDIQTETGQTQTPLMATLYYYLSNGYIGKKDITKAMEIQQKCLKLRLELLGNEHQDVAMSYHGLGRVYEAGKDFEQAIAHEKKAYELYQKLFGADSRQAKGSLETIEKYQKMQRK